MGWGGEGEATRRAGGEGGVITTKANVQGTTRRKAGKVVTVQLRPDTHRQVHTAGQRKARATHKDREGTEGQGQMNHRNREGEWGPKG